MTTARHLEPGWDMHEHGDELVRPEAHRLAPGARVAGVVVCHHAYGLGMYIERTRFVHVVPEPVLPGGTLPRWNEDRDEYGHVDIPVIKPGRLRGPEDFPRIGSRVEGTVAGYTPMGQLRVMLYVPRAPS